MSKTTKTQESYDLIGKYRQTPLHTTCEANDVPALRSLLSSDEVRSTINYKDAFDQTALHIACQKGNANAAELLLNYPEIKGSINEEGRYFKKVTPLHLACQNGLFSVVKRLLDLGANIHAKDEDSMTPLLLACKWSHADVVRELLSSGARIDSRDKDGKTVLHYACEKGSNIEVMKVLLAHPRISEIINATDRIGETAMHYACFNGQKGSVELLLERREISGSINAENIAGQTPLYLSLEEHRLERDGGEIPELLLSREGVEVNRKVAELANRLLSNAKQESAEALKRRDKLHSSKLKTDSALESADTSNASREESREESGEVVSTLNAAILKGPFKEDVEKLNNSAKKTGWTEELLAKLKEVMKELIGRFTSTKPNSSVDQTSVPQLRSKSLQDSFYPPFI